jgi:hypothetical protein
MLVETSTAMTGRTRHSSHPVFLSPTAALAAHRLAGLTGLAVSDLLELLLQDMLEAAFPAAAPQTPAAAPLPVPNRKPPAPVIPIQRARGHRDPAPPEAAAPAPAQAELEELRRRGEGAGARPPR